MDRLRWRLFRELVLTPLKSQYRELLSILIALAVVAASQSSFLLLMSPMMTALFGSGGGADGTMTLLQLAPKTLHQFLPSLSSIMVTRELLVVGVPLGLVVTAIGTGLGTYMYQTNQAIVILHLSRIYRQRLFLDIVSMPYREIINRSPSDWMSALMNDVQFLQARVSEIVQSLFKDSLKIVSAVAVLFVVHVPTATAAVIGMPILAFGMGRIGKKIAHFAEQFQQDLARIATGILGVRKRFEFIRAQGGVDVELNRFDAINQTYFLRVKRSIVIRAAFAPGLEFIGFSAFALIIVAMNRGWISLGLTAGTLVTFLAGVGLMVKPLGSIGEQFGKFHETKGVLRRSLAVMESVRSEKFGSHRIASSGEIHSGNSSGLPWTRTIPIARIAVAYGGNVAFAASMIELRPAIAVAIIGPSGSGKSSLLRSLAGLIEPDVWESEVPWRQVADATNFVSQTPFLFSASIRDNLTYGLLDGPIVPRLPSSDEKIWGVLTEVGLAPAIDALPGKLGEYFSAVSMNLSGGQIQRLVIARALLRQKPILLLDEATSALDGKTEEDVVRCTLELAKMRGVSVLAVTHRLHLLTLYDEIWFVEGGTIVAKGTHLQLLGDPRYQSFIRAAGIHP